MGNEVNEVINNICDKLGILANELIPEMGKMKVAELGVLVGFSVIMLLVAGIIAILYRKRLKADDLSDEAEILMIAGMMILSLVAIGNLVINAPDFIGWIASPKAKTFEYVLKQM